MVDTIKRRNKSKRHTVNPYELASDQRVATIFAPDDYKTGLVALRLPPIALRLLWVMLSRINSDGSVLLSVADCQSIFQTEAGFVRSGVAALIRYNFIQRRTIGEYWINPDIAYPMVVTSR